MMTDIELSIFTVLWRSGLAALIGMAIGWERRASGSPVRARILALVAMTATALTAIGLQMPLGDLSRILAGLLSGVGFIGAGVLMGNDKGEVRGLTTAAALWATTGVSIVIGLGYVFLGLLLALMVYFVISWDDWPLFARFRQRRAQQMAQDEAEESI
jgi:putative Mg2+ transporter-C (MgtC) family protein